MESIAIPENIVLEAGGIEQMPNGKVAVSTRRGDIFMVSNLLDDVQGNETFSLWARGLHEVLGLSYADGWLYVTQRPEITRIKDSDSDGRADLFETVSDEWGISGDYHEYAFGSKFDPDGNMWVVQAGSEYKLLRKSELNPPDDAAWTDSTPAVAHDRLYVRLGSRVDSY